MKDVLINDEAMSAIRSASTPGRFRQTGRRVAGGWLVPLSEEAMERIAECAFPGESVSDTIVRLMAFYASEGRAH